MNTNSTVCLLLEDEPLISMDLELILGNAGFAVTTVMSCDEALEWLGMLRPDIVIVDIQLRDGRSDKVVELLIENEVPFIVHSGDHPIMHEGTPFAEGTWVDKPAAPDELVGAARALLATP